MYIFIILFFIREISSSALRDKKSPDLQDQSNGWTQQDSTYGLNISGSFPLYLTFLTFYDRLGKNLTPRLRKNFLERLNRHCENV